MKGPTGQTQGQRLWTVKGQRIRTINHSMPLRQNMQESAWFEDTPDEDGMSTDYNTVTMHRVTWCDAGDSQKSNHSTGSLSVSVMSLTDILNSKGDNQINAEVTLDVKAQSTYDSKESLHFQIWIPKSSTEHDEAQTKKSKSTKEERRRKVAWPNMCDKEWEQFDSDLDKNLQISLQGSLDKKLQALPTIALCTR